MLRPWDIKFSFEGNNAKTLHSKLLNCLISDIKRGRLLPGSMLPGTRTLAKQLNINRKTVQYVYEELEVQGWLKSKVRRGTFVAESLPEQTLSDADSKLVSSTVKTKAPSDLTEELYIEALAQASCITTTNDGTPDARLIPYELLARTYRRICVNLSRRSKLGYGDPRGALELRMSLQKMVSSDRYINCSEQEICIVRGSQMGIYLASRVLDPTNGAIVMEELCYAPAQATFEANGFKVLKCKLDKDGLNIEHLQKLIRDNKVAGIYVTPHHQYPTTVCLPMERRLALLRLSKCHHLTIIEDDYDHEFHYETNPIPPLASLPNSENVVHIGSMSKVFAPGLRLGYIVCSTELIQRAAQEIVLIDRQGNTITEHVVSDLMETGEVKRHIRKVRREYRQRRDHTVNEFSRIFGSKVSFDIPTGGLAIWVDISKMTKGKDLSNFKSNDSILSTFFNNAQQTPTHIRFGFGSIDKTEITHSIQSLYTTLVDEK